MTNWYAVFQTNWWAFLYGLPRVYPLAEAEPIGRPYFEHLFVGCIHGGPFDWRLLRVEGGRASRFRKRYTAIEAV